MGKLRCPICSYPVHVADFLDVGNTVDCVQCDSILKITSKEPLEAEVDSLVDDEKDPDGTDDEY